MEDLVSFIISMGNDLFSSKFALDIILLVWIVVQTIWMRRALFRHRQEMRLAVLECTADSLVDQGHLTSLRSLCFEYRMLYLNSMGGKREVHPEMSQVDQRFDETRRGMHDARTFRLQRAKTKIEAAEAANEKDMEFKL